MGCGLLRRTRMYATWEVVREPGEGKDRAKAWIEAGGEGDIGSSYMVAEDADDAEEIEVEE